MSFPISTVLAKIENKIRSVYRKASYCRHTCKFNFRITDSWNWVQMRLWESGSSHDHVHVKANSRLLIHLAWFSSLEQWIIRDKIKRWMGSRSIMWHRKACSKQCWLTAVTSVLLNWFHAPLVWLRVNSDKILSNSLTMRKCFKIL